MTVDNTAAGEEVLDDAYDPGAENFGASTLSLKLQQLREQLMEMLPAADLLEHRGELTVVVEQENLHDTIATLKTSETTRCELLSDVTAVHWPGGVVAENPQETTGWPTFTSDQGEGRVELDYILRSLVHGFVLRVRTDVSDDGGSLESVTDLFASANLLEREIFDLMGVVFTGHPNLTRIMMPETWEGHPLRKDYPLGGVEVMYKGQTVPPPDERDY